MNKLKKCVLIGLGTMLSLHSYGGKQQFNCGFYKPLYKYNVK